MKFKSKDKVKLRNWMIANYDFPNKDDKKRKEEFDANPNKREWIIKTRFRELY